MAKKEEFRKERSEDMTLEEAIKRRASLHKPAVKKLTYKEKREAFRLHWAKEKTKYNRPKALEEILWLHLKAIKMDEPENFEKGINHFGLKKEQSLSKEK